MRRSPIYIALMLSVMLCMSAKAQQWVKEIAVEDGCNLDYGQCISMDNGNAMLVVGAANAQSGYYRKAKGYLLKVYSDGNYFSREIELSDGPLLLCSATALDDGHYMVFGLSEDSLQPTCFRRINVIVVDSLLETVSERQFRIDTEGFKGICPLFSTSYSFYVDQIRCAKALDGNVVLGTSQVYTMESGSSHKRYRFYEFSPEGDTVRSTAYPEYINGLMQTGYNIKSIFTKPSGDGFVFIGAGSFPNDNDCFGVWNLDWRDLSITTKSPIHFGYPLFYCADDICCDGRWYGENLFMTFLSRGYSYDDLGEHGYMYYMDTLAGRHGEVQLPRTDINTLAHLSQGCNTAYVNDSTIFAVTYSQNDATDPMFTNITLLDRQLNILGNKTFKDVNWNCLPTTPVAMANGSIVVPITETYLNDGNGNTSYMLYCFTRDDIEITWDVIEDNALSNLQAPYPNPVLDCLTIPVSSVNPNETRLRITDLKGYVVVDGPVSREGNAIQVDVRKLTPGTYIYQVTTANRTDTAGKFIKE